MAENGSKAETSINRQHHHPPPIIQRKHPWTHQGFV